MLHDSSLKRPASHLSSNGVLDSAGCVPEPLFSAMRNATADGDHAAGEVEDSVMSAEDLNAITDPDVFRKTAFKLGLTVRFKPPDGSNYKCRRKAYIVEDYRQQLANIAEVDLPLRQCMKWYKEASRWNKLAVQGGTSGHVLFLSGQLVWCERCGCYSDTRVKGLLKKCPGPPSDRGRQAILRGLLAGNHPSDKAPLPRAVLLQASLWSGKEAVQGPPLVQI